MLRQRTQKLVLTARGQRVINISIGLMILAGITLVGFIEGASL